MLTNNHNTRNCEEVNYFKLNCVPNFALTDDTERSFLSVHWAPINEKILSEFALCDGLRKKKTYFEMKKMTSLETVEKNYHS